MKDLLKCLPSFAVCQCGLCCSEQYQCDSCLKAMLNTAGLSISKYFSRVKGKKSKNPAYAWDDYSEVILEMRKILSQERQKRNKS